MWFVLLAACSPDPNEDTADGWPIDGIEVTWSSCSLVEGEDDGRAECSATQMPLFWDDRDDGRTIEVWAKRLLSDEDADAQLWLLSGGPGASGLHGHPGRIEAIQDLYGSVDVYTIDHRGTGYSERMGCTAEDEDSASGSSITSSELADCMVEFPDVLGDRADAYSTTMSSVDVAALVEANREDQRVFIWGGSYGAYWAQRYLAVMPDQADGVIIEGILPVDGSIIYSEPGSDAAGRAMFDLCAGDTECCARLGDDPAAFLADVLARMEEGHCTSTGMSRNLARAIFAYLMYSRSGMSVIPAATYRLDRCTEDDEAAIVHLYNALFGDGGTWDKAEYSIMLQFHVMFSEIWTHPDFEGVDLDAWYADLYEDAIIVKGNGRSRAARAAEWPVYSDPDWDDVVPQTDVPMLMLQGELDPVTPASQAVHVGAALDGEHQTYVSFPYSAHSVSFDSPVEGAASYEDYCGVQLMLAFMEDPTATVDTSCVADTATVDFDLGEDQADYWLGTDDYWD